MKERYVPIRLGIEEHLLSGGMSLFEFGIYVTIHMQANFRNGTWRGSAPRIMATVPRGANLRDIQRALEHLEKLGYLKSFRKQGQRGNRPYLIDKFTIRSGALKGMRVNAARSETWLTPIYDSCALLDVERDAECDTEIVAEDAPTQEVSSKKQEVKKETSAPPGSNAVGLSGLLRQRILENNPSARITERQLINWAREADLMIRRDGRTDVQIRELIEWSQTDSFWRTVVLSMGSLRDKFDRLTLKKNETGGNNGANRGNYSRGAVTPESGKYRHVPIQRVTNTAG